MPAQDGCIPHHELESEFIIDIFIFIVVTVVIFIITIIIMMLTLYVFVTTGFWSVGCMCCPSRPPEPSQANNLLDQVSAASDKTDQVSQCSKHTN